MKFLLIASNTERNPYPVAPLGALFVAASAESAGVEVKLLDMSFEKHPARRIARALRRKNYDAVGLSIRNLDDCSYFDRRSFFQTVAEQAAAVRAADGIPLILGGGGFSVHPQGWMDRLQPDYGVIGEGEHALLDILRHLGGEQELSGCAGIVAGDEDVGERNGRRDRMDALPVPAHGLCDYKRYQAKGGFVGIQTRRGCPCKCIYCVYPEFEGKAFRLRNPLQVAEEIAAIARDSDRRWFFFTDSVFNMPRVHALDICRAIIDLRIDIGWMAYVNPLGFDREMAELMKAAGCVGLEFGLDAATDKGLQMLGKPFSQRQIASALDACAASGIPMALHMLYGGPGETVADVEDGQDFLSSCVAPNGVFASVGLRIYDKTPLKDIAAREGVISAGSDLFEPEYYLSPDLGHEPLKAIDRIARRRPEWSSPIDWDKLVMRLVRSGVNRFGGRPQWRNVRNYGKYMRR